MTKEQVYKHSSRATAIYNWFWKSSVIYEDARFLVELFVKPSSDTFYSLDYENYSMQPYSHRFPNSGKLTCFEKRYGGRALQLR